MTAFRAVYAACVGVTLTPRSPTPMQLIALLEDCAGMSLSGGVRIGQVVIKRVVPRAPLPATVSGMWRWKTRLLRPIRLEDGRIIRTLADAHNAILQLPEKELRRPQWQALVDLLLSAVARRQHHLLSILTARLETELPKLADGTESVLPPKRPPAPSAKHRLKRSRRVKLIK
jgi:hypothetical protein